MQLRAIIPLALLLQVAGEESLSRHRRGHPALIQAVPADTVPQDHLSAHAQLEYLKKLKAQAVEEHDHLRQVQVEVQLQAVAAQAKAEDEAAQKPKAALDKEEKDDESQDDEDEEEDEEEAPAKDAKKDEEEDKETPVFSAPKAEKNAEKKEKKSPPVEDEDDGEEEAAPAAPAPKKEKKEIKKKSAPAKSEASLPFGDLEPFGRENAAQELTEESIRESDAMVDQIEKAELAEEQRSVFRALTRLRGAALASFDGIAKSASGNIQEYAQNSRWRKEHPVQHLASEEADVEQWAFPSNAD